MTSGVPSIFWTTIFATAAILILSTLIGRWLCRLFPGRVKRSAQFYLAPVLGLAILTIVGTLLGWVIPLGNSVFVPLILATLIFFSMRFEISPRLALRHAFLVAGFGVVCSAGIWAPLAVFGGIGIHNDTFTYLAHGYWLQNHAFREFIDASNVTPLTTQVALYQQYGLRMGGSFLLALLQAALNLEWSLEVYPSVAAASVSACCLAIGFPLHKSLQRVPQGFHLLVLALPALSLGGLVFGATLGFLPQTVGLAFAAGLLFALGPILHWIATTSSTAPKLLVSSLPLAVLTAAAIFAYSELAPFLFVTVVFSSIATALRFGAARNIAIFVGSLSALTILLLDGELARVWVALRIQADAVVGTPVNWGVLGYLAHALGLHGGAWDAFQWSKPQYSGSAIWFIGLAFLLITCSILLLGARSLWHQTANGVLAPVFVMLAVLFTAFLYFRYFVNSPFAEGEGQTWSQFKLANWAHPFAAVILLSAITSLMQRYGDFFRRTVIVVFATCLVGASVTGVVRVTPLMNYYQGVDDLNRFYLDLRRLLESTCPRDAPIYMALYGEHHKFRQMATLYLPDREVRSDWTDDGYIYSWLPSEQHQQRLTPDSCVLEPIQSHGLVQNPIQIGAFQVGVFNGRGKMMLVDVEGAHSRETDGVNWWHWVEKTISFSFLPFSVPEEVKSTRIRFEYSTRGSQAMSMNVVLRDGSVERYSWQSSGDSAMVFERLVAVRPSEIVGLIIETDGEASPLGESDGRMAAYLIRNLIITPYELALSPTH
jgi:hypothetical protein